MQRLWYRNKGCWIDHINLYQAPENIGEWNSIKSPMLGFTEYFENMSSTLTHLFTWSAGFGLVM